MIDFDADDIKEMMKPTDSILENIERQILRAALSENRTVITEKIKLQRDETIAEFASHYRAVGFEAAVYSKDQLLIKW